MAVYGRSAPTYPPVVSGIILACIIISIMQNADPAWMLQTFALWPIGEWQIMTPWGRMNASFHPGQLITSAFLHGGFFHLLINMLVLWMFGSQIENIWGSVRFAFYYFFCVIGASLLQLIVVTIAATDGMVYPTIGASGGVFGILLAFALLFPNQRIMLLIPPVPIKAKWFVVIMGGFSLYAGFTGMMGNVAHFAHIGGMVFGLLLMLWWGWRPSRPWVG